mgnify:CR=1 FL=1
MRWNEQDVGSLRNITHYFLIFLLIQLILSCIYYPERIGFLDASFVLVKIINEGTPAIMVGRYGSILTQMWPWLGVKLGLSIDQLMLLYSASFPMLNFICAWILYKIKQYSWVVVLGFYQLIFNTESYFWTNNELHQAMALFCLGIGMYHYFTNASRHKFLKLIVSSLIVCISIVTHPLMLIVASYFWLFFLLEKGKQALNKDWILFNCTILVTGIAKYISSKYNWYDSQKIKIIQNIELTSVKELMKDTEFVSFFHDLPTVYPIALIGMVLLLISMVYYGLWKYGVLSYTYFFIHLLLVSLVVDINHRFYTESQYMLMSIFITAPIFLNYKKISPRFKSISGLFALSAIIWWVLLFRFTLTSYSNRVKWIENMTSILHRNNQPKAIISSLDDIEMGILKFTWGLPSESLLLSTRNGSSVTLVHSDNMQSKIRSNVFHDCFKTRPNSYLNPKYFRIDEDAAYILMDSITVIK